MERTPNIVHQQEENDCSIACIAMLHAYYDRPYDYSTLSNLVSRKDGTVSVEELIDMLSSLGWQAEALVLEGPVQCPSPSILYLPQGHFVLYWYHEGNHHLISDPAIGMVKWSNGELYNKWLDSASKGLFIQVYPPLVAVSESSVSDFKPNISWRHIIAPLAVNWFAQVGLCLILPLMIKNTVDHGLIHYDASFAWIAAGTLAITIAWRLAAEILQSVGLNKLATDVSDSYMNQLIRGVSATPSAIMRSRQAEWYYQRVEDIRSVGLLWKSQFQAVQAFLIIVLLSIMIGTWHIGFAAVIFIHLALVSAVARWSTTVDKQRLETLHQARHSHWIRFWDTIKAQHEVPSSNQLLWLQRLAESWKLALSKQSDVTLRQNERQKIIQTISESTGIILIGSAAWLVSQDLWTIGQLCGLLFLIPLLHMYTKSTIRGWRDRDLYMLVNKRLMQVFTLFPGTSDEHSLEDQPSSDCIPEGQLSHQTEAIDIPWGQYAESCFHSSQMAQIRMALLQLMETKSNHWKLCYNGQVQTHSIDAMVIHKQAHIFSGTMLDNILLEGTLDREKLNEILRNIPLVPAIIETAIPVDEWLEALQLPAEQLSTEVHFLMLVCRALYQDPDLLVVIDIPTSEKENETMSSIFGYLREHRQGKTTHLVKLLETEIPASKEASIHQPSKMIDVF